jgi:flagellar basal body-associated protein FliL
MADELTTDDAVDSALKGKKAKKAGKAKGGNANLVPAVIVAAGLLGGGFFFSQSKSSSKAAAPTPSAAEPAVDTDAASKTGESADCKAWDIKNEPKRGGVAQLAPMTINLEGDHYAKVAIALQLPETVALEEFVTQGKTAIAADQVNKVVAGRQVTDFATPQSRDELKKKLDALIRPQYDCEVLEVLVTDFVTQ